MSYALISLLRKCKCNISASNKKKKMRKRITCLVVQLCIPMLVTDFQDVYRVKLWQAQTIPIMDSVPVFFVTMGLP